MLLQKFQQSRKKFLQALVDNISSRFPDYQLLKSASVLDQSNWPDDEDKKILFGDSHVAFLVKKFHMPVSSFPY